MDDATTPNGAYFAGNYRIGRELARGGFGPVFEATQLDLNRPCALKVLHPHVALNPKFRAYFEREAQASAHLQSDHVVQVYAAGVDAATGQAWMAMELLDGESLETRLKRGPLDHDEARTVFRQVGHALAAAHRVGVVHCDLKPSNVQLTRSRHGSAGELMVKVLDFGIARVIRAHATSALGTTAVGSPRFMAPEQGYKNGRIKAATDVWALAMVSFHSLTGGHYWRNAEDVLAVIAQLHGEEVTQASARARELGAESRLPDGYDDWFEACTRRDLDAREQDVAAAAERLGELLSLRVATPRRSDLTDNPAAWGAAAAAFSEAEGRGDLGAMLGLWEGTLSRSPAHASLRSRASRAYATCSLERERAGDLVGARRDADQAIALAPEEGAGWYARSRALRLLGDARGFDDLRHAAGLGVALAQRELTAQR